MFLPHVHHLAAKATLDLTFEVRSEYAFWLFNPPLYFASRSGTPNGNRCACIPDLRPLLAPIAPQGAMTFVDAPNTQAAAKLVVEDWADSCVTNLAGLKSYELRTIAELKKMNICWIPITKREAV
ncbi:MAG: hypothetical protein U0136_13965 [Bdellovibrionota bacterium]